MDAPDVDLASEAAPDHRGSPRRKVFRPAVLTAGDGDARCHILNLSLSGALLDSRAVTATGTVALETEGFARRATVRWSSGSRAGVRFDAPLAPEELDAAF